MSQPAIKRASIAPYICVRGAAEAIDFYVAAFGAEESFRLTEPEGRVGHAELRIGDGVLMISDEYPDFGAKAPPSFGGSPVSIHLSVADCDASAARAEAAGATLLRAPKDEFYGDRSAMVACPFGYRWHLTEAKEEITPAQMQARWTAMLEGA